MLIILQVQQQHMMLTIYLLVRIGLQTATAKLKTNVYTEADPNSNGYRTSVHILNFKRQCVNCTKLKISKRIIVCIN